MATVVTNLQSERNQKGLVIEQLSQNNGAVVRCVTNAKMTDTVLVQGQKYTLRMLPTSIVNTNVISVIARGNVIDLKCLAIEIMKMKKMGVKVTASNLAISQDAYVIMPWHVQIEDVYMQMQKLVQPYPTIAGVGVCYLEKEKGKGIRVSDLFQEDSLLQKINSLVVEYNQMLGRYIKPINASEVYASYFNFAKLIRQFVCDTSKLLLQFPDDSILLEGELLENVEVDCFLSPDSTSSLPMVSLACNGAGYCSKKPFTSIGVIKPYLVKRGEGRFATEVFGSQKKVFVTLGHEYNDLTCDPLRCGWLDMPKLSQKIRENGIDSLILTHLDVVGKLEEIKVCIGYQFGDIFATSIVSENSGYEPVYYTFAGEWNLTGWEKTWEELPDKVKYFVLCLSSFIGIPICYIEIGKRLLKVNAESSK